MATSYYLFVILQLLSIFSVLSKYSIKLEMKNDCNQKKNTHDQYFDITHLKCRFCSQNNSIQSVSNDGLSCVCNPGYKYIKNMAPRAVNCVKCGANQVTSKDGWSCVYCHNDTLSSNNKCASCIGKNITVERKLDGEWIKNSQDQAVQNCVPCKGNTIPNGAKNRCVRCTQILSVLPNYANCTCPRSNKVGDVCFQKKSDIIAKPSYYIRLSTDDLVESHLLRQNLIISYGMCHASYFNSTACQSLGNMCVLLYATHVVRKLSPQIQACTLFRNLSKLAKPPVNEEYDVGDWPYNMPWLYYSSLTVNVLNSPSLPVEFTVKPPTQLKFLVVMYSFEGKYLGMKSVRGGLLQLCKMNDVRMDAIWTFGTTYSSTCYLKLRDLFDNQTYPLIFYDLYLRYSDNGEERLYAIPIVIENHVGENNIRVNKGQVDKWVLTRRFFLVDNVSTRKLVKPGNVYVNNYVRFAQYMKFVFRLQPTKNGLIYPPYLKIVYGERSWASAVALSNVPIIFKSEYLQDETGIENSINIAFGTLSVFAIIYAGFNTWAWSKRSARISIDFATLVNLFLNMCASLGSVFFFTILGIGIYFLLFFKQQNTVIVLPMSSPLLKEKFSSFIVVTFCLKFFHMIQLLVRQCTVDMFFIDWEKPKSHQKESTVSAWRVLFVANEWVEIQTSRRINIVFQLLSLLFLLIVVGFENFAFNDASSSFTAPDTGNVVPQNRVFRFTLSTTLYLLIATCQWLYKVIFYERFIEDIMQQFIDLCSLSNISVFMMDHLLHGYYIHGRSVHGKADTNFRGIQKMMSREQNDLCSERGLLPNTEQQSFEMSLPNKLRTCYVQIMMPVTFKQGGNRMENGNNGPSHDVLRAHEIMNKYLSSFIDHSLKDADYSVKDKTFLENVLNAEFIDTSIQGIFYNDNGHSFDRLLFYGHEILLVQFEILLFNVVDLIWQNFILAAALTYVGYSLISLIRQGGSKKNIARKTLVDRRFLI
ncbi:meckelin-like [Octopus sinensis]|uniref:Meckelin-like n=1 Tax=Octopus sinensis TaxID=2607531 RepID=A0A6P7STJ0_9MOLL|nr:meckelin-like [Octopus sinensis]